MWASENKIVTGFTDTGLFKPADPISREQMAAMMYRYARYKEAEDIEVKGDLTRFPDRQSISDYAKEAVEWSVGTGMISGMGTDGMLAPQGTANRAECAAVIQRYMER